MPEDDKQEIIKLIEAGKAFDKKWNIFKIASVFISVLCACFYLGSQVGEWREWRIGIDTRMTNLEQSRQKEKNDARAEYNRKIIVKNP